MWEPRTSRKEQTVKETWRKEGCRMPPLRSHTYSLSSVFFWSHDHHGMGANSAWLFTLLISGVVTSRGNTQAYLNAHACTNAKKPHLVQMWIKLQKANGLDMCVHFPNWLLKIFQDTLQFMKSILWHDMKHNMTQIMTYKLTLIIFSYTLKSDPLLKKGLSCTETITALERNPVSSQLKKKLWAPANIEQNITTMNSYMNYECACLFMTVR